MRDGPVVSVLVLLWNDERFVRRTLKSILSETSVPIEVIVSDDGSTDGSRDVVRSIRDRRITLIEGPREGIAANFNAALAAASGDIIMRCDSDDLYPKGRIGRQVARLASHPEYGAVCGSFAAIRGWISAPLACAGNKGRDITDDLNSGHVDTHFNTYAVRREVLMEIGGANTEFRTAEDIDLQLRISEVCRVAYVPEVAYYWRLSDASITHTSSTESRAYYDRKARSDQARRLGLTSVLYVEEGETLPAAEHLQRLLIGSAWSSGSRMNRIKKSALAVIAKPSSGWRNLAAAIIKPS